MSYARDPFPRAIFEKFSLARQGGLRSFFTSCRSVIRKSRWVTAILGFQYTPNLKKLELDLTYLCNLKCLNCNRSSTQAPSRDSMTLEQVKKLIAEAITQGHQFEVIRLLGGEPTLHPEFLEIVQALLEYKNVHCPGLTLIVISNGSGNKVNQVLSQLPEGVLVRNTEKSPSEVPLFEDFNVAPQDLKRYRISDYRNGCFTCSASGIGLSPYGYYPCVIGAGIDRVFGLGLAQQSLPLDQKKNREILNELCRRCGHFKDGARWYRGPAPISQSWSEAYDQWALKKPELPRF